MPRFGSRPARQQRATPGALAEVRPRQFETRLAPLQIRLKRLLVAGTIFTLTTLLVPLFSGLGPVLLLQAIAGVSSGTFYTLTLTFVIRSLPPKLLLFGVAAYAMDIVVSSNVAALIEGWYIDHLSWHWIFWTAAVLTPVMMLCVYFGIPKTDSGPRPSWRGFLYASAGFALIYGALDQGQRLNWWNSGTFVGMLAAGVFLLLVHSFGDISNRSRWSTCLF